jgi:hypothetical protein
MKNSLATATRHVITLKDHLWVHERTHRRAYEIWVSSGCRTGSALNDWLQAEDEVLIEFCQRHMQSSARSGAASRERKLSVSATDLRRHPAGLRSRSELPPLFMEGKYL